MNAKSLFNKIDEMKERFAGLFQHRKKLKALENFSLTNNFKHRNYLPLIKECMNQGFLQQEEADFLDHMLKKYELNYLDWSHRTKWLKGEIERLARESSKGRGVQMDMFEKRERQYNVPMELLAASQANQKGRFV